MPCPRLLFCVALLALLVPAGVWGGPGRDSDRDGVPDFVDNCRERANLNQRDSDGDGLGNRCDPDLDGDGRVDLIDLALLSSRLFGDDPHADLDSNGHVGRGDLRITRRFLFGPPGPGMAPLDSDGDGIGDRDDACIRSNPHGGASLDAGCNLFDLVRAPERFAREASLSLSHSRDHAASGGAHPSLDGLSDELAQHVRALSLLQAELRLGNLCRAAAEQRFSATGLGALSGWLETARAELSRDILRTQQGASTPGSPAAAELRSAALARSSELLDSAHDSAESLAVVLDAACQTLGPREQRRARVMRFDDAARVLVLADGSHWLLADPQPSEFATAGRVVSVEGTRVSAAGGIARRVRVEASDSPPEPGPACAELALAPVQGFAPWSERAPLLHALEAYRPRAASPVYVEAGMRVALRRAPCEGSASASPAAPAAAPAGLYWRDSARVEVEYQRDGIERELLAADLVPGDEAVALPELPADARRPALRVSYRRQGCRGGADGPVCGPVLTHAQRRWPLHVAARGDYCDAHYDASGYALEGAGPRDWRAARVTEVQLGSALDGADSVEFAAEGCRIEKRAGARPRSSCEHDELAPIRLGERFAVHGQDFGDGSPLHALALHGVGARAALRWPRVTGERRGEPFRYACRVPRVARDALDRCSEALVSFYRAPLAESGSSGGESADTAANQAVTGSETAVRAARAGEVVLVHSEAEAERALCVEQRGHCEALGRNDCWQSHVCPLPSHIYVRHADGSFGAYWNLSRVDVEAGQTLERGDSLGAASRASDLHFRVQAEPRLDRNPPRSVAFQNGDGSCWIAPAAPEGS